MEKFAGYGFNKCHAAAYAQVAYQTAYLKANYPVEFFAASMTLDIANTDKLNIFRREPTRADRAVAARHQPVFGRFHRRADGRGRAGVRYALAAVKGVGAQAMRDLVAERAANGLYKDLFDFAERLDQRVINKRLLESSGEGRCLRFAEQESRPDLRRGRGADAPFPATHEQIARQQPEQPVRRRHRAAPAATAQGARLGADGAAAAGIFRHRLLSLVASAGGVRQEPASGWE